jgi:hypothetical protein
MFSRKLLGVLVLCAAVPALCQVTPAARKGGIPVTIGAGYSNFDSDWNGPPYSPVHGGWISGYTLWGDWTFYQAPALLQGIAIEVEGRDLNFGSTGNDPVLRQRTGEGGVLYAWRHFEHVHPYGKIFAGYGGMTFTSGNPYYHHDTRTVIAEGLGVDFIVHQNVVLRVDFENQNWSDFRAYHSLTPRGFTFGIGYDFKRH